MTLIGDPQLNDMRFNSILYDSALFAHAISHDPKAETHAAINLQDTPFKLDLEKSQLVTFGDAINPTIEVDDNEQSASLSAVGYPKGGVGPSSDTDKDKFI